MLNIKLDGKGIEIVYIARHAESAVWQLSKMFGAVLVAGPRQVGKTTMLKEVTKDICLNYVTMDDLIVRAGAREERRLKC